MKFYSAMTIFLIKILIAIADILSRWKQFFTSSHGGQNDTPRSNSNPDAQSVLFSTDTENKKAVDQRIPRVFCTNRKKKQDMNGCASLPS